MKIPNIFELPRFPSFSSHKPTLHPFVLFCNHPSSACRRDMEPRSQEFSRFWETFGCVENNGWIFVPVGIQPWPTAVGNFTFFYHHLGKIGRKSFLVAMKFDRNPITVRGWRGVQSPKAKIWGVPLPFSVSVSDRIGSLKILTLEKWRTILRTPKHPCVSYRFSHPKPLEGSGDILSAGAMCTQTGVICSGFGPLDRFSKKSLCLEDHPS